MQRYLASIFALVVGVLAAHPLSADEALTSAAGTITLDGQPLPLGRITFYLDDDQFVGSRVKNGAYKVTRVPVGQWRVTIEGDGVPAGFSSEEAGPFRTRFNQGHNTFDFDIKRVK